MKWVVLSMVAVVAFALWVCYLLEDQRPCKRHITTTGTRHMYINKIPIMIPTTVRRCVEWEEIGNETR